MAMTLEQYHEKIHELQKRLWEIADEAANSRVPVGPEFQEVSEQHAKAIRNARAWCKRHGLNAPVRFW